MSYNKQIVGIALGILFSLTNASTGYLSPDKSRSIYKCCAGNLIATFENYLGGFFPKGENIVTQNPWCPNSRFFVTVNDALNRVTIWDAYTNEYIWWAKYDFKIKSAYISPQSKTIVEGVDGKRSVIAIPSQDLKDTLAENFEGF